MSQADQSESKISFLTILILVCFSFLVHANDSVEAELKLPPVLLPGIEFDAEIKLTDLRFTGEQREFTLQILLQGKLINEITGSIIGIEGESGQETALLRVENNDAPTTAISGLVVDELAEYTFKLFVNEQEITQVQKGAIWGILAILPPIIAIGVALITRQVVTALLAGIFIGALFIHGFNPLAALLRTFDHYIFDSLLNSDHLHILVFSIMLGGLVGIISRNGGAAGIVAAIVKVAKRRRSGMIATWLMGLAVFFDDYSNTLIVGNTMRPFTDRFRISREKLAYIVDSTAAPVATLALVSTWIGFQVGLIGGAFESIPEITADPYSTFIQSIPYNFYAILALYFVFLLAIFSRDFGPMAKAELRAIRENQPLRPGSSPLADYDSEAVEPKIGVKQHWINAALPILSVIVFVISGIIYSGLLNMPAGTEITVGTILENTDSFKALLWASFGGVLVAVLMSVFQGLLSIQESVDAVLSGMKSMMLAAVILTLAWAIGMISDEIGTSEYVVAMLGQSFPAFLLPAMTFILAAAISFSTGSSWATMSILMPLIINLSHSIAADEWSIMLGSIASVLAGSVFGDHCSPISDTTVMSSLASACDHIDHVQTQLPYALTVGGVTVVFCFIPEALGLHPFFCLLIGLIVITLIVRFVGRPVNSADTDEDFIGSNNQN
jgi:Na+/H+ antiporter NhaC